MKKRIVITVISTFCIALSLCAQASSIEASGTANFSSWNVASQRVQDSYLAFNTEHLDSIDQEQLPSKVTLGLLFAGNISNFIIHQDEAEHAISSHMQIGCDFGGFIDFMVTRHFAIQGQVVFTAEQNRFGVDHKQDRLWSFGATIPVYFLGRFGNLDKGYLSFGAGPFTHVTFASNVKGHYANNTAAALLNIPPEPEEDEYSELYKLHRFHSGLAATVVYEFPFSMQIFASYMVSLTDIFGFYSQYDGTPAANASIYPQRVSLGLGYRFRHKTQHKQHVREGKDHL